MARAGVLMITHHSLRKTMWDVYCPQTTLGMASQLNVSLNDGALCDATRWLRITKSTIYLQISNEPVLNS